MDGFDFKGMLSLKVSYGKKIVTVAYYAALIVAAFAMLANIVGGFVLCIFRGRGEYSFGHMENYNRSLSAGL